MTTDEIQNQRTWSQLDEWQRRISESWMILTGKCTLERISRESRREAWESGLKEGYDRGVRETKEILASHIAEVRDTVAKAAKTNQEMPKIDIEVRTSILSTRVRKFCEAHNIKKVSELAEIDDWEYYRFPNFGETSRQEVDKVLKSIGLKRKRWTK